MLYRFRLLPAYAALMAVSLLFLFPFYWVVISSLKSPAGMDLKPPALYPAEAATDRLEAGADRLVEADGQRWLLLAESPDVLAGGKEPGAYLLRLEDGRPTQLVAWFPQTAIQPARNAAPVTFEDVRVHRFGEEERLLVAKVVRQREDGGFDELLFTVPRAARRLEVVRLEANAPHREVRVFRPRWQNYPEALKGPEATIGGQSQGFLLFLRNSLFISSMAVLGQILSSSMVAFGFARLQFKGRELLFVLLLATLMIPGAVTTIPLFGIYKSIGWIDTFLPLIVPHFTAGAFNVFLIRQFLLTIPRELDESAMIDGASPWRIYRSVVLPNCASVLIVVGLFTFVGTWQDVMGPLIYLDNPAHRTVTLGLEFFRSPYVDNRHLLMTGAVLAMIPVATLFLIGQRYILSGIATTGMKN